jgi:hypothetical protein
MPAWLARLLGRALPPSPAAAATPGRFGIRPEGLESLDQFLAELWPAGLRRLKTAVEDDAQ